MITPQTDRDVFRFEDYEFTARDCELRRAGEIVPLARKPSRLLLLLLRDHGRFVSREEILATVWPDVRVSEAAVNSVVRDLRRALHDEARQPRLIATSRGRGLRFLAPVEVVGAAPVVANDAYVGRAELLDRLRASAAAAIGGTGRLVLLGGEAGIGKTRTAAEIVDHARRLGASVHLGRCWPPGTAPPYNGAAEILASIGEELGAEWSEQLRVPSLARLLAPEAPIGTEEDQARARLEAFDAVATALCRAARIKPLVLTIDDLENGTAASLQLIEVIAGRIGDARILILACYRTSAVEEGHPLAAALTRLARLPNVEQHLLHGFDAEETARFLGAASGREIAGEKIETLHRRTDGNPFLLRLLARSSEASTDSPVVKGGGVPTMVRDWIRGTLASLPADCIESLRAAAVLGRLFRVSSVAAMLEKERGEVEASLAPARRAGLLAPASGASKDFFAHSLLHEAVYQDIPAHRRSELHWRAAEAVRVDASGNVLAAIAHHLNEAVEFAGEGAVLAAERAADDAERRLGFEDAVRLRQMALQALDTIGAPAAARRCELLLDCARAQLALRQIEQAWETARSAAALARRTGNVEHLARAALMLSDHVLVDSSEPAALLEEALAHLPAEPTRLRGRVAVNLSQMLWYRGSSERRLALAREALEIARAQADPRLEVGALIAERNALSAPDQLSRRLQVSDEALVIAERLGLQSRRCLILSWRAVDRLEGGDVIGAQLDVDSLTRVVEAGGAQRLSGFTARWLAMRAILAGHLDQAEQHVHDARVKMLRSGDPNADAYAGIQGGVITLERGRSAEIAEFLASAGWLFAYRERVAGVAAALAMVELEAGVERPARSMLEAARADDWKRLREDPERLGTASWLAELCARIGDATFAKDLYELLAPFGDRISCFYAVACRGALARYLGLLARTAGHPEDAERWFEKSVVINRAIGAELFVAWSQWEWAESIAQPGDAGGDLARARQLAAESARFADEHDLGRLRATQRSSPWANLLGVE